MQESSISIVPNSMDATLAEVVLLQKISIIYLLFVTRNLLLFFGFYYIDDRLCYKVVRFRCAMKFTVTVCFKNEMLVLF